MTVEEQSKKKSEALSAIRIALNSDARKVDPLTEQKIEDSKSDRGLKKLYAKWFIGILIGQLLIMNLAFTAVGLKWMGFEKYELELYLAGTLAEVFGIVLVITKNLFPQRGTPSLK